MVDHNQRRRASESNTRLEKSKPTQYTKEAAQKNLLSLVGDGYTIVAALDRVGRSYKAYEQWRASDPDFKKRVDAARALNGRAKKGAGSGERLDFASFRRKYLKTETFWHQLQWVDILEGREPRELHPAQTFHKGKLSRILVNVPPFHAKSSTITIDYTVFRICMDPGFRVIIVSEAARLAEDFLAGIKTKLTHPDFLEMQLAYAPEGGWKQTADSWKQNRIVVGAAGRDAQEKDPTVQAIGIGGQIYGSRCDLVILDDTVTGNNVREWEKQMAWIKREVASRIEMGGKLLVIGTRIAPVDLYAELMNPENYANSKVPWTYMCSPAILEEGETPAEHVTLWPYADRPWQDVDSDDVCDCEDPACSLGFEADGRQLFPRWDGLHLEIGPRADNNASGWALVYQQRSMDESMTFPQYAVQRATSRSRRVGLLQEDHEGHPPGGMHGMYVLAGCDPSIKGFAGITVWAFEIATGKRFVLSASNLKAPLVEELKDEMKRLTEFYSINEWRVEKTGLLQFFTQDEALRLWFSSRGIAFGEHQTDRKTKWDATYGVASLAQLFGAYEKATGSHGEAVSDWRCLVPPMIELPISSTAAMKALVHQLVTWTPSLDPKRVPQDLLMACWFVEVRCRELAIRNNNAANPFRKRMRFASPRDRGRRVAFNLTDIQNYSA